TPDIRGTPGTFLFFTDDPPPNKEEITGGEVIEIAVENNKVEAEITGPKNIFRRARKESANRRDEDGKPAKPEYENPDAKVPFAVYLDPEEPVAKLVVQNNEIILKQGEWSEWVPISFDFIPHIASISAIGRFYLQEARPKFKLYLSPLQINPDNPAMPISTPSRWSRDLCDNLGYFYTKELPEETKALSGGIFNGEEFWEQSQYVYHEQRRALDHLLDNFHEGLLFFYYSSVDQGCHMLWRYTDPAHPGYVNDPKLADSIQTLYTEMDESLGRILKVVDRETVLIVMSDHGFSPFYWGMNLNSWLLEKGYIKTKPEFRRLKSKYFAGVDWKRTKAYAIGLNGLYINAKGREHKGGADEGSVEGLNEDGTVVPGSEYEKLLDQLEKELLDLRDTRNGKQPVTRLTRTHRDFHGPYVNVGHDAIVGYNYGYRTSWESPLGEFPRDVFVDNKDAWSGDHCIDFAHVPGVLITNQKITLEHPALSDLTPINRGRICCPARQAESDANEMRGMMFRPKVKLDKTLYEKAKKYADIAGYSSVEEFVTHMLEREIAQLEEADSEEEIKKKLQGLGYIS
ncbi:alkaline phosphatase family protein, partial [Candidatus Sumerlaeota bacterium]|nr:alkaline phosphatase family protein [Candidatus Sumerlaeota bacterium]